MEPIRNCGCKGCRTCLLCEKEYGIERKDFYSLYKNLKAFTFCPLCSLLYEGWDTDEVISNHANHRSNRGIPFPGVLVRLNFLSQADGALLMANLDELPWEDSQSGRRKQNFGPKTNFKKMKLQTGQFCGFPEFSKFVQEKFKQVSELKDFQTIEQCTLEYDPAKGASIDPHIDDCWIWGERVVTVNCLGDSVLTLARYKGDNQKYNLHLVDLYENSLMESLKSTEQLDIFDSMVIRIPMPNLSLIVLYGPARYQFEHSVLREDVPERRVCVAYREFTPMYLEGGNHYEQKGQPVIEKAQTFWRHKT